jgi:hypothetical protein
MNGSLSKFTAIHWFYSCPFIGCIAHKEKLKDHQNPLLLQAHNVQYFPKLKYQEKEVVFSTRPTSTLASAMTTLLRIQPYK